MKKKRIQKEIAKKRKQRILSAFFERFNKKDKPKQSQTQRKLGRTHHVQEDVVDFVTVIIVSTLTLFGWVMIYSGSFYLASQRSETIIFSNNPYHYFILQGMWIIVGCIVAYTASKIPFQKYRALIVPVFLAINLLLIFVLLSGGTINGAKLWIKIGGFTLQPSEFAKPIVIVYLSAVLSKNWHQQTSKLNKAESILKQYLKNKILPFLLIIVPITTLVLAGKDLASAIIIFGISGVIFFMSDDSSIHNVFTATIAFLSGFVSLLFAQLEKYRMIRLQTYFNFLQTGEIKNPLSEGYQLNQILIAVGSGGFHGLGFGQAKQTYLYLQETAFTDTIYAVIAEQFGFIGITILILIFLVLFLWWVLLINLSKDKFAKLTLIGITTWIMLQAGIHMGVNVGLLPLTGITLPFMSYGGSSLISCFAGVGIVLSISRDII